MNSIYAALNKLSIRKDSLLLQGVFERFWPRASEQARVAAGRDGLDISAITATAAEINRATDLSSRIVTIVETGAITAGLHDGKTCLLAEVGGNALVTLTLPAATGSGARFRFVVNVVNTSSYVFKSVVGTDLMEGIIFGASTTDSATDAARTWLSGASDDTFTLNGTTTGGAAIGDWVEFEDITATGWAVRGNISQSGVEATPFSNTVA